MEEVHISARLLELTRESANNCITYGSGLNRMHTYSVAAAIYNFLHGRGGDKNGAIAKHTHLQYFG